MAECELAQSLKARREARKIATLNAPVINHLTGHLRASSSLKAGLNTSR